MVALEASDGEDAVRRHQMNRERVRLVLCDVIMPRKNGAEVHETIRQTSPDVRIVFLTLPMDKSRGFTTRRG